MSWLRGLQFLLVMTCRDVAPLISRAMDQRLGTTDRTAIRLHLAVCPSCRRYRGQLTLLRRVLALVHGLGPGFHAESLSLESRRHIRKVLEPGERDS